MRKPRRLSGALILVVIVLIGAAGTTDPVLEQADAHNDVLALPLAEPTCLLFGWINSSSTHEGIEGAIISVASEDYAFSNYAYTNETGYFCMEVPRCLLYVYCLAGGFYAYESDIDATGQAVYRLDVELNEEPTVPVGTIILDQNYSISQHNPLVAEVRVEDFNLKVVSITLGRIHNRSGEWLNITSAIAGGGVFFREWGDSAFGDFQYSYEDGVLDARCTWPAVSEGAGYLVNSNSREHVQAYGVRSISGEVSYGISAYYTNDTVEMKEGLAWFNNESGEYEGFQFLNFTSLEDPDLPDAAQEEDGVITPFELITKWKLDWSGDDDPTDWYELGKIEYPARPAMETTYEYDDTALSGEYVAIMMMIDEVSNWALADELFTVDTTPPVADAGEELTVVPGTTVAFDGSGSSDNIGIVNFTWRLEEGGEPVTLFGETPSHMFLEPSAHEITLTVRDAGLNEDQVTTFVCVDGLTPIAEAGPSERTVPEDLPVVFDGGDSQDDFGIMEYLWEVVELEEHWTGEISMFTFDQPGTYHVELVVVDNAGRVSEPDSITVTVTDETPPDADAGEDMIIVAGESVVLNGSASTDNVAIDTWVWSGDDSGSWTLMGMTVARVFETPGTYEITLEVFDGAGNSDTETLTLMVVEHPVADAGQDIDAIVGEVVFLNAYGSSDDTEIVNYTWTFEYDGETVVEYGEVAAFVFDIEGVYEVNLTVTDDLGLKGHDTVEVTVTKASTGAGLAPYVAAAIVVLVAAAVIGVMLMRRRKVG